jgi:serine/threonine protein kinase
VPDLTQEGTIVGTPHYMSPEQACGLRVDRRTDLYALGCVLYEMIVGTPPFVGATPIDIMSQQLRAPVPAPVSPHGPVPHALARVVRRAMAKNPRERHQTAAELIADLSQAELSLGRSGWRHWLP